MRPARFCTATVLLLTTVAWAACRGEGRREGRAGVSGGEVLLPSRASQVGLDEGGLVRGTPPGGLRDWVSEIREGVRALPAEAVRDVAGARRRALDLYVTRQEYVEIYYGPGGRLLPAAAVELGAAVKEAEARFHELLQLLNQGPAPDSVQVAAAVERLDAELTRVLAEADSAGAPASPRDTAGAGSGGGLDGRVRAILAGLEHVERAAAAGDGEAAGRAVLRLYLDEFEPMEAFYGPGGPYAAPPLAERVMEGERAFHALIQAGADSARIRERASALRAELARIREAAGAAGVPLRAVPGMAAGERAERLGSPGEGGAEAQPAGARVALQGGSSGSAARAQTREVAALLEELEAAEAAYRAGDAAGALAGVERAYLDGFEPLEARLPAAQVSRTEALIHVRLRPLLARGAGEEEVLGAFADLQVALLEADTALAGGSSFWFGAMNGFVIVVREGLEAVLLIAALVAYLGRMGAERPHLLQIYGGAGLALAASFATWLAARTIVPLGGASRELVEGVTALVAVGVLLYVSHWLFQKTYIHDWKEYLKENLGRAVSKGSTLAMASLAFAAVYREGFETVLFYQALLFDAGAAAVTAGFVPGLALMLVLAVGIVRLGLRLPLQRFFAATNALLLYLAFAFLGKGLYSLQEAGVFAPHPLSWMPDHSALRQVLGVYPLLETLVAHTAFLILLAATYLYYRRRCGRAAEAGPPAAALPWARPRTPHARTSVGTS